MFNFIKLFFKKMKRELVTFEDTYVTVEQKKVSHHGICGIKVERFIVHLERKVVTSKFTSRMTQDIPDGFVELAGTKVKHCSCVLRGMK